MTQPGRRIGVSLVLALVVFAGGCGRDGDGGSASAPTTAASARQAGGSSPKLKVVTTVAPITSIAANVAGGLADIEGVVPEGTNSHTFEPAPSVAEVLSEADLIFINGLVLEEPTKKLAERNLKRGAKIVEIGTEILPESEWIYDFSFPKEEGKPNPHLWTDPTFARRYAEVIRRELSAKDQANAAAYQRNYDAFSGLID
jgi:manganese/iron transport system substrate-binding protein